MVQKMTLVVGALLFTVTCFRMTFGLSYAALETLLNLETTFTIQSLEDNVVQVYRKDLPRDYIAYWQVVMNDKDFVVVSAGPKTSDYRVTYEGRLPTFSSRLDDQSRGHCAKYYMLAPDGLMACEDNQGTTVAVGMQGRLHQFDRHKGLHDFVTSGQSDFEKEFKIRADEVDRKLIWEGISRNSNITQNVRLLRIRDTVRLPVSPLTTVHAQQENDQGDLCAVIGICDEGNNTIINREVVRTTQYGVKYVEFTVKYLNKTNAKKSVFFTISIPFEGSRAIQQHYIYRKSFRRSRRWSTETSIPNETEFPDYNQFMYGDCHVGCGPVAWASVFGYLDRLSHRHSSNNYVQLYRAGSNGITGSADEVAPQTESTTRIQAYIKKLHDKLDTFCVGDQGATYAGKMSKRLQSFYQNRVTDGELEYSYNSFLSLIGLYRNSYRLKVVRAINRGFPAIIGWKTNGKTFKQHYPIVTKYRTEQRTFKSCPYCDFQTVTNYQFYLHMGWGGTGDGWHPANAYMMASIK